MEQKWLRERESASAKDLRLDYVWTFKGKARRLGWPSGVSNGTAVGAEVRQVEGPSWALYPSRH